MAEGWKVDSRLTRAVNLQKAVIPRDIEISRKIGCFFVVSLFIVCFVSVRTFWGFLVVFLLGMQSTFQLKGPACLKTLAAQRI